LRQEANKRNQLKLSVYEGEKYMPQSNFSVTALLNDLSHLDRQSLIETLREMRDSHLANGRSQLANKFSGVLAVIESGIKNLAYLTKSEVQEIRPTMEKFVEQGSLDKGNFDLIFSN
jgi:hypothetical protein